MTESQRIVVAMSGGVDSSVAAALLKEQGHEVVGMTMQLWDYTRFAGDESHLSGTCCSIDDVHDARRVAGQLDIPFYVINFEKDFQRRVIDRFCEDYFEGRTPNPCVLCNQTLKFELLLRKAREIEADYLVTGHYARIVEEKDRFSLRKGRDPQKDQSYFLFTLTRDQMTRVRFPLGDMTKEEVRDHAARLDLKVAEKSESQDICFVPDGDYVRFLEEERGAGRMDGEIVHVSGDVVGRHRGTYRYTVGQRRGLGISWKTPLYVVAVDAQRKQVIVGEKEHLAVRRMTVSQVNWIDSEPAHPFSARCRIRYRHRETPAEIAPLPGDRAEIRFESPQKGVTPGQAAVFFDGDRVIGGGWIE